MLRTGMSASSVAAAGLERRQRAIRELFESVERKFGSIEDLAEPAARNVITVPELNQESLSALFKHEACAIHVPGFYNSNASATLAARLLADPSRCNWYVSHSERGMETSDVASVGMPFNVAVAQNKQDEYFASAIERMRVLRSPGSGDVPTGPSDVETESYPHILSPFDKLRLELDEVWSDGATVSKSKDGRAHVSCVARITEPCYNSSNSNVSNDKWTRGFMHVDDLAVMATDKGLFSANVYLQQPPIGGELQIWPITIRSRWDFYRHASTLSCLLVQDKTAQERLRRVLPEPVTISPKSGDLVLICAQRPHAIVAPVHGCPRVSLQGFLQYEAGKALRLEN